jgi:DNA-binding GntR family transcriptional regulator
LINAPVVPPQAMAAPARARYLRALHREHSAILAAIGTRDAEAARRAARRHILRGEARFRAALPDAP